MVVTKEKRPFKFHGGLSPLGDPHDSVELPGTDSAVPLPGELGLIVRSPTLPITSNIL